MKVKFLGGADLVGKLGMLCAEPGRQHNVRVRDASGQTGDATFPLMPEEDVEGVFITHAHLDHSGKPYRYWSRTQDCEVFCNEADHGHRVPCCSSTPSRSPSPKASPRFPYKDTDIKHAWQNFSPFYIGETRSIAGLEIQAHNAGHIPGAQMYELKGHDTTLFTGDLRTENTTPDLRGQAGEVRQSGDRGHLRRKEPPSAAEERGAPAAEGAGGSGAWRNRHHPLLCRWTNAGGNDGPEGPSTTTCGWTAWARR
ncbi:MAG: hypothetical protein MZV70_43705 [Desulfobacterales bacterium]|nr:hypothetical protein [Desulfobacterales bacterium]